jgi:hypothetical protein
MKRKTINLTLIVIIVLVPIVWIYLLFLGNPITKYETEKEFEHYLADKYSEPMVVESLSYDFESHYYYAGAHPKNNNNLRFIIDNGRKTIKDTYLQRKWANDIKTEVLPYFNETMSNMTTAVIGVEGTPINYEPKSEIPNFFDIKSLFNDSKNYVAITIFINKNLKGIENDEYSRIFKLVKYINERQLNPKSFIIEYGIEKQANPNTTVKIYEDNTTNSVAIYKKDILNITSVDDIAKFKN